MPFYEYRCNHCHDVIERLQKINDPGPGACHQCNQGDYERIPSLTAFHLQGSGWYKDGYSSQKKNGNDTKTTNTKTNQTQEKPKSSSTPSDD